MMPSSAESAIHSGTISLTGLVPERIALSALAPIFTNSGAMPQAALRTRSLALNRHEREAIDPPPRHATVSPSPHLSRYSAAMNPRLFVRLLSVALLAGTLFAETSPSPSPALSPRRLALSVLRPRSPPPFGTFNGFPAGGPMLRAPKKIGRSARSIAISRSSPPMSSAWRKCAIPSTHPLPSSH